MMRTCRDKALRADDNAYADNHHKVQGKLREHSRPPSPRSSYFVCFQIGRARSSRTRPQRPQYFSNHLHGLRSRGLPNGIKARGARPYFPHSNLLLPYLATTTFTSPPSPLPRHHYLYLATTAPLPCHYLYLTTPGTRLRNGGTHDSREEHQGGLG